MNHWPPLPCNSLLINQRKSKKKLEQNHHLRRCVIFHVYFLEHARTIQMMFVKISPGTIYKFDGEACNLFFK